MALRVNHSPVDGTIISFQEGGDGSENDCPDGAVTIVVDPAPKPFFWWDLKVANGQLVNKKTGV